MGSMLQPSGHTQHPVQTVTSDFLSADDLPPGTHLHLIVLNYILPQQTAFLWKRATTRICADGGANRLYDQIASMLPGMDPEVARNEHLPDLIKGDLDSVRPDVQEFYTSRGIPMIDLSSDQETTDLEKCLLFLEGRLRSMSAQHQPPAAAAHHGTEQHAPMHASMAVATTAAVSGAGLGHGAKAIGAVNAARAANDLDANSSYNGSSSTAAAANGGQSSSRTAAAAAAAANSSSIGMPATPSTTDRLSLGTTAQQQQNGDGHAGPGQQWQQQQQPHGHHRHDHGGHHHAQQQQHNQDQATEAAAAGAYRPILGEILLLQEDEQQQQEPGASGPPEFLLDSNQVGLNGHADVDGSVDVAAGSTPSAPAGRSLLSRLRGAAATAAGSLTPGAPSSSSSSPEVQDVHASVVVGAEAMSEPPLKRLHQEHIILVLGALGGRLDHTLSNLNTLYCYRHLNMALWGDGNLVRLLRSGRSTIKPSRLEGPTCGLVPLARPATASSSGLKWDLDNTHMCFRGLLSTSNIISSDVIEVSTDEDLLWITAVGDTILSKQHKHQHLHSHHNHHHNHHQH